MANSERETPWTLKKMKGDFQMEQTRNKSIFVRVTNREKSKIISKAKKCGLTLSEYIRQVCLGYEPKEIFRRYQ